jgi:hypothetical protein
MSMGSTLSKIIDSLIDYFALVVIGIVAAVYFTIRFTSGLEISQPLESKLGIQQRAAALEKTLRYNDWMHTRVRRGGWVKGILLWPIEPTEAEMNGSREFVTLSYQAHDFLFRRGDVCGGPAGGDSRGRSDSQNKFLLRIVEYIQNDQAEWKEPAILTLLPPIQKAYPCSTT